MNGLMKEGSLGSILHKSQIISEDDIRRALDEQQKSGCRFGEALVKLGVVTQEDIDWALSNQLNIPYVRLKKGTIDPEAVACVPGEMARRTCLIPLIRVGDELSIAIADPLNSAAIDEVERLTGCRVAVSVALLREIREMQEEYYGPAGGATFGFASETFPAEILDKINADLTGGKLIDYLLLHLLKNKMHLVTLHPRGEEVVVLGRRGEGVRQLGAFPATYYPDLLFRLKRLTKVHGSSLATQGSLAFGYRGAKLHFQAHFLQGTAGTCVTLKKQFASPLPDRLSAISLDEGKRQRLDSLVSAGSGLVLFAIRDHLERARFIDLFLEERGTSGRTVVVFGDSAGAGTPLRISPQSVDAGGLPDLLTAALDHEPDIVVVEDCGDVELFVAAAKAALRGKLVLVGMPVQELSVLFRQLLQSWRHNLFVPSVLRGVITARSILQLCTNCREPYQPTPEEIASMRLAGPPSAFYRPGGCPDCDQTGYASREYLVDVIPFDDALLATFETARESGEIEQFLRSSGYCGCREEALALLAAGLLTPVEYITAILL